VTVGGSDEEGPAGDLALQAKEGAAAAAAAAGAGASEAGSEKGDGEFAESGESEEVGRSE